MSGCAATLHLIPMLVIALATGGHAQPAVTPPASGPKAEARPAAGARPSASVSQADTTTTPKGTLKLLASALRDGDAERIRQVMHATSLAEERMVASMADMAKAMALLQKAAVKEFGEEGAKELVGDTQATDAEGRARIDASDVKVIGDTATVIVPEGEDVPVVLKRVAGHWKVPMAELSKNADTTALDERLTELTEQRKLVAQLTEEIAAGQFNSPAQAKDAWQSRAMQVVTRRPPQPPRKPQPDGSKPRAEPTAPGGDAAARPASGN